MGKGSKTLHKNIYKKHNNTISMDEARQAVNTLINIDMMLNGVEELEASKRVLDGLTKNLVEKPKKNKNKKHSKETLDWIKRNMK